MYPYGLVGNCQISALISDQGSIDWLCLPRPDAPPVFGRLLDPDGGAFSISLVATGELRKSQRYIENTNVLITEIADSAGNGLRITDFCPRFEQFGRIFRPMSLFRIAEPILGFAQSPPIIQVACEPLIGWEKKPAPMTRGNSHLTFAIRNETLRLTTTMPLTYLTEKSRFQLKEKLYFGLTWSTAIEEDIQQITERSLQQTIEYWRVWVKHCSIPSLFQDETIRSALALKLHCFEDTGAILAALTTSLPEELGGTRNWDYRFCWLRDSYFVLSAFHSLGHFEEMEAFLKFLLGVAHQADLSNNRLAPVYSLTQQLPLPETIHSEWQGFGSSAPVRTNNQAAEHVQNDVYGEMVLTLAPIYFDDRFVHLRDRAHEELLTHLACLCEKSIGQPDAGLWEIRNGWQIHTFAHLMSWAGLERAARIQQRQYLKNAPMDLARARDRALESVMTSTRNESLRNSTSDESFDASLALCSILRFPDLRICKMTVQEIRSWLSLGKESPKSSFFYRYRRRDDFGEPQSSFLVCSFWIAQALARLDDPAGALTILRDAANAANQVGLLSEHFDPTRRRQLGNFPQAYSHVGLINAAFAVSPPWSEVL